MIANPEIMRKLTADDIEEIDNIIWDTWMEDDNSVNFKDHDFFERVVKNIREKYPDE